MEAQIWRHGCRGSAATASIGGRKLAAQTAGGRPSGADSNSQRGELKKVVSPSAKRRAVKMSVEESWGKSATACRAMGLARSSYYARPHLRVKSQPIRKKVIELSEKNPRYGYRRIMDATAAQRHQSQCEAGRVRTARPPSHLAVGRGTYPLDCVFASARRVSNRELVADPGCV